MSKPTVIFVLGMHRSGTSALAGALAASGVWLGRDLLEPAPGVNDKGFWEHKELVRINECLLELAGLHWYTPLGAGKFASFLDGGNGALDALKEEGRAFVQELLAGEDGEGAGCVAIKDPRLCLTASFWQPLFEDAGVRVTGFELIRHPAEVGRSLAKRDGIVPTHSNVLWLDHVLASIDFCRQLDGCFVGSFDDLMASPLSFTGVALKELGVDLKPDKTQMDRWIQEDLRHHKGSAHTLGGLLADEVELLFEDVLQRRSVDSISAAKLVNRISAVFDDIEELFESYNRTVMQLQDVSERLERLGEEHSRALETVQERDEQLEKVNAERDRIGALHQKALDTVAERDNALAAARGDNERLSAEVQEERTRVAQQDNQISELGASHHHAIQVVEERDRQLADLNQRIARIEASFIGKLLRVWARIRKLTGRNAGTETEAPKAKALAGITEFPVSGQRPSVDVIVPVYGGLEETAAAITTASKSIDRSWARLVVINDCSPEPAITRWLRDNSEALDFELLENEQNLGFVGTVNRGMRLRPEADVLLLNSDVEVANDWLERLQDCAYSRDRVASVTATANNATICSFPVFCEDNELPSGFEVQSLDEVFRASVPANMAVEIPTGIGCCMYMRRDSMDAIGLFDEEVFGRGYGEENDWCQRAIKHGWQNLHALNVFVYHKGAVSFAEESDPRKEENLNILAGRYPTYHQEVQNFIEADPANGWRTLVYAELLPRSQRVGVLAISHGLGGGVKTNISEINSNVKKLYQIVLEPVEGNKVGLFLAPELERGPCLYFDLESEYTLLVDCLRRMAIVHVHFHHTMRLPTRLWGLPTDLGVQYDYTLHDYWVVNGNPTLTNTDGVFVGDRNDRDKICAENYPLPEGIDAKQWRINQLPLMSGARYLISPSYDTAMRIASENEFNNLNSWLVAPHPDHSALEQHVGHFTPKKGRVRVVIVGALSKEKGADLLEKTAMALADEDVEFHLLGYAYRPLNSIVRTHGAYPEHEGLERVAALNPDVVWFPAQWPETYSYTLSLALKGRYPIVAPKLGAFIERLANRKRTVLLSEWSDTKTIVEFWRNLMRDPSLLEYATAPDFDTPDLAVWDDNFYSSSYLKDVVYSSQPAAPIDDFVKDKLVSSVDNASARGFQRNEAFLRFLLKARATRVGVLVSRAIPYRVQKYIKRRLSNRPIHEILR